MKSDRAVLEIIIAWTGVITSFITPFLPLLQFVAVSLAIAISIKQLVKRDRKSI
jgi:hypothetical protein